MNGITMHEGGGMTFDTPEAINFFRLASLKGALKLECKGMKMSRGVSAYAICKKTYGLKGNKESVLAQVEAMINAQLGK